MIAIVDYGVGNLFSLKSSLEAIGADAVVTGDAAMMKKADKIILPGVGALGDAADKLRQTGLDKVVVEEAASGKPLLGICLGMQLLFDKSLEYGEHCGLGLVSGVVDEIKGLPSGFKVPHMGWNALRFKKPCPIYKYIKNGDYVYFVHSYHGTLCGKSVTATADYGVPVTASVMEGNIFGTQFHPEKSGETGLKILTAFAEL